MSRSLSELQRDFAVQLLAEPAPDGRIAVYHNNRRANFCKALTLDYPITERIVGSAFFAQVSLRYLARFPSRSGDLHHVGTEFADFLAKDFAIAGSGFEYLVDLARLERAWATALIAADAVSLEPSALGEIAADAWPGLRLALHPAVSIVDSAWPVHSIFLEHRKQDPAVISLAQGGESVAVLRRGSVVEAHRLSTAEGRWWQAIASGQTLLEAIESAGTETDALAPMLGRMFALGVIVDLRVRP